MDMPSSDQVNDMREHLLQTEGHVSLRDRILLSTYTKLLVPSLLIGMTLPFLVYTIVTWNMAQNASFSTATCNIKQAYYVNCLPGKETTEADCLALGCCWNSGSNYCYHSVPSRHGYTASTGTYYEGVSLVPRRTQSPFGSNNVAEIRLDVSRVDSNHVSIALVDPTTENSAKKRRDARYSFAHREAIRSSVGKDTEDELTQKLLHFLPRDRKRRTVEIELDGESNLSIYAHNPEFSVTVARRGSTSTDKKTIFSTALGPLLLTESYFEWTMYTGNGSLFGLNDLELNGTRTWIYNSENGTITPTFLAIDEEAEASAYYIDYDGPLEIEVLNESNLVIIRGMSLPGSLTIHVFAGPTPLEAIRQLTMAMSALNMPPRIDYGVQICPGGEISSIEDVVADLNLTIATLTEVSAPWDSHCIHERLVSYLNQVLGSYENEQLSVAREYLAEEGRTFTPHLSPMIITDNGTLHAAMEDANMLLLSNESIPYVGTYHDELAAYPEWQNIETRTIATDYLLEYLNSTGSPISVWVRDAWPKDERNTTSGLDFSAFDYMPEQLEVLMNTSTIPHDLKTPTGYSHHVSHNAYAESFRSFVRSSISTVEFSGPTAEAANTTWSGLRRAVRAMVGSGIAGQLPPPMYICGTDTFNATLEDELCLRWYQAAVAAPHVVVLPDRMPGGSSLSTSASLVAARILKLRASLVTYQYTLVANHFLTGTPILAPTLVYYPEDTTTSHTWNQFMWGDALMVGLVTLPMTSQVDVRLPGDDSWRHLMGGTEATSSNNGTIPITATSGQLITLVRPGYVVPIHTDVGGTTLESMQKNMSLVVNLLCSDVECLASGTIYYGSESGAFLDINISTSSVTLQNVTTVQEYACVTSPPQSTFIETVELLGNATYQLEIELCDITTDIYEIPFSEAVN